MEKNSYFHWTFDQKIDEKSWSFEKVCDLKHFPWKETVLLPEKTLKHIAKEFLNQVFFLEK